jgi:CRP-like cAMP-binding protein
MPFSLNSISRLIAYPHHQAVQSLGSTALLDGKPRSANVQAEEVSEVYRLSFSSFSNMLDQEPKIAAKLVKNIALVLSDRLRARSNELRFMVDY